MRNCFLRGKRERGRGRKEGGEERGGGGEGGERERVDGKTEWRGRELKVQVLLMSQNEF